MNKPHSNATGPNPKDIAGSKKVDITALPPAGILHGAHACMSGAGTYGPYNWRAKPVMARGYIAAALRHLLAWLDGEEIAQDTGVHHIGHAIGGLSILIDAQECGTLIDDRPTITGNNVAAEVLARLNAELAERAPRQANESKSELAHGDRNRFCNCDLCRDARGDFR